MTTGGKEEEGLDEASQAESSLSKLAAAEASKAESALSQLAAAAGQEVNRALQEKAVQYRRLAFQLSQEKLEKEFELGEERLKRAGLAGGSRSQDEDEQASSSKPQASATWSTFSTKSASSPGIIPAPRTNQGGFNS
mmetsp:Transcript_17791/g.17976  ORF Transcript_17791/g.17976 Transcript_17791/m.17976 type:complete len:137 (-) Transcript_17791:726-1136(-)